jgi:hypothetical protein
MAEDRDGGTRRELEELRRRVSELETRVVALETGPVAVSAPVAGPVGLPPPPVGRPLAGPGQPLLEPVADGRDRHPVIDLETALQWIGIVLVVLAAVFLVSTAISRGWIGPELQLLGAAIGGLALVGGGIRLVGTRRGLGETLVAGGAVVLPLTATASHVGLDVLPIGAALVWTAVTVVVLAAVAWRLDAPIVALAAAATSLLVVPWIDSEAEVDLLVLGGWITVAALGWAGVGLARDWPSIRQIGTSLGGLLLWLAAVGGGDLLVGGEHGVALAAGGIVAIAGWLGPAAAHRLAAPHGAEPGTSSGRVENGGGPWWMQAVASIGRTLDHRSLLWVPIGSWLYLGAVLRFTESDHHGWWGLALAAAYVLLMPASLPPESLPTGSPEPGSPEAEEAASGPVDRWLTPLEPARRSLMAGQLMGITLLITISMAVGVDAPALLVALAVQAAGLGLLAHRLDDRLLAVQGGLFGAMAVAWTAGALVSGLVDPLSVGQHVADAVVVAVVGATTLYGRRTGLVVVTTVAVVATWIGSLVWLATVVIHGPQGQVVVSIMWAAAAAAALVHGVARSAPPTRALGFGTLVVVVIKLLTVDLSEVDTLWRVGLFFMIGASLLRLGYVLPRLSATTAEGAGGHPGEATDPPGSRESAGSEPGP